MAASIWATSSRKKLIQLIRFGLLTKCHASCQNFKLSRLMDEKVTRCNSTVTSSVDQCIKKTSRIHRQYVTNSSMTEVLSSRKRNKNDKNSGQMQSSRVCHQILRDSNFGPAILSGSYLAGLHLGTGSRISIVPARLLHQSRGVLAGHNKWSKVKHIKGPKDAQRSLLFNKLILQMRIAVKENGPNPELNSTLASLVSQAKSNAMPKATIEGILKNVKKGSGADADTQLLLEARGPGQSCLLIDVLTDNAKRTRNEIQRILQKNGGDFGTSQYAFSRKGVVRVHPQSDGQEEPLTLDLATEVAIEVGAEDVKEMSNEDDVPLFMFICHMGDLRTVRNNLASLNYAVESSLLEYLPQTTIALNDKTLTDAFHLISLLNDNPSVVKIYDNVESSS